MDGNNFLKLNNGKKLNFGNFQSGVKKSDLTEEKLRKIFDFFDTDKSGTLESAEVETLWNTIKTAASKTSGGDNSVFDATESETFISENFSISDKISISNLTNFLTTVFTKQPASETLTAEDAEDTAVESISRETEQVGKLFAAQNENQGDVSNFVNGWKELFDTKYAGTRVERAIKSEELSAKLLEQAKKGELTEAEYYEAKLNLALEMLPRVKSSATKGRIAKAIVSLGFYKNFGGMTESEKEKALLTGEIEFLKSALAKLSPEKLDQFISRLAEMSDEEFNEKADKVVENMLDNAISDKMQEIRANAGDSFGIKRLKDPNSVEAKLEGANTEKKLDFAETFKRERGVEYNPEAINDYTIKNTEMQTLLAVNNKVYGIIGSLMQNSIKLQNSQKLQDTGLSNGKQELAASIKESLTILCGNDSEEINQTLSGICGAKGMTLELLYGDSELMVKVSSELSSRLTEYLDEMCGGKTLAELGEETGAAYKKAYGDKNLTELVNSYVQSQKQGVQTVKEAVNYTGMAVMIAGQLVPVAGQAASIAIGTGLGISALGSTAVDLTENLTKAGGATREDWEEMGKELVTTLALIGSGMKIGKMSEGVFRSLVMKNCPKLLAWTAEVGVDAAASLAADMAITGQIDLTGEGRAQLQALLVGLIKAKGNFKNYVDTHTVNAPKAAPGSRLSKDDIALRLKQQGVEENKINSVINLCNVAGSESLQRARITLLSKLLTDEKFSANKKVLERIVDITAGTNSNNYNKRLEFLSMIKDEELSSYVKDDFPKILNGIFASTDLKALKKIITSKGIDEKRYIDLLLFKGGSSEINGKLVSKLLSDEKLYNNKYAVDSAFENAESWMSIFEPKVLKSKYKDIEKYLDRVIELKARGLDDLESALVARISKVKTADLPQIQAIISTVKTNYGDKLSIKEFGECLNKLVSNPKINLAEFMSYIKNLNMEEISNTVPRVKDFTAKDFFVFAEYHYKNGTTEFTKENLTLTPDFTKFLNDNYVSAKGMADILAAFPATDRNIGKLPNGWLDKVPVEKQDTAFDSIQKAIDDFRLENRNRDCVNFASKLGSILGKDVEVECLGGGAYGIGYKISVSGSTPVVLKLFHAGQVQRAEHGAKIEPQTGAFVSKHSNNFVQFFFGRVAGSSDHDSYLVTQYLDNKTSPIDGNMDSDYIIESKDAWGEHNIINGKIIDYGDVHVKAKDGSSVEYELENKDKK